MPARLQDLDACVDIGLELADANPKTNGERFGLLRGVVLKAWPKTVHDGR